MRYAISYVSTAHKDLQEQEVDDIMNKTNKFNKAQNISGILLYNERNFFQLLEGEKKTVEDLYAKIIKDSRHDNIIKFLDKKASKPPYDGYLTDFITDTNKFDESELKKYLHYIEVLSPASQKALKRVIEMMRV